MNACVGECPRPDNPVLGLTNILNERLQDAHLSTQAEHGIERWRGCDCQDWRGIASEFPQPASHDLAVDAAVQEQRPFAENRQV
jgi:hypothetical protein